MVEKSGQQYDYSFQWMAELAHILNKYRPEKFEAILEWGAGVSTAIFHNYAVMHGAGLLVTVDNHKDYLDAVVDSFADQSFLRAHLVPLSETKSSASEKDHCFYSTFALHYQRKFDVIFVDGRIRNECLLMAALLASPKALIILHDFRRARMAPVQFLFEEVESFRGALVLKRKPSLEPFFDGFLDSLPPMAGPPIIAKHGPDAPPKLGYQAPEDKDTFRQVLDTYLDKDCKNILEWGTGRTTDLLLEHTKNFAPDLLMTVKLSMRGAERFQALGATLPYFKLHAVSQKGRTAPGGRDPNWHFSSCPMYYKQKFDFVYVGRERRNECLMTSALLLAEGGTAVLRDGDRLHYASGKHFFDTVEVIGDFHILKRKPALDAEFDHFLDSLPANAMEAEIDSVE